MLFGFCASWLGTSVRILQRTAPACPTYFSGVASTLKISCPPGASDEFFNCSALSCPAAKASCPVAKPPFCSTTRFREAYTTNFHAIGFSPAFIFRLKDSETPGYVQEPGVSKSQRTEDTRWNLSRFYHPHGCTKLASRTV